MKILTIGNSFADNATQWIEQLAKADGNELVVGKMNIGGCSLEKHWNLVEQCRLLPEIKPYHFYHTGCETVPATLKDALQADKWDYITLQQVSDLSWKSDSYYPYIERLYDFVKTYSNSSEVLLHQTWAYRVDANEFKILGINQNEMQLCLENAYKLASKKLGGLKILPCGTAFKYAREKFGYVHDDSFDYDNPKLMALPNQENSLIKGYFWKTGLTASGKAELCIDGRHGNAKGVFLAGLVWYHSIFGADLFKNTFLPDEVCEKDAEILKACAVRAVREYGYINQ